MQNARRPIPGLLLRGCTRPEPLVCCGSAVGQRFFVPVLELAVEVPQFHRAALTPALGDRHRRLVILRFELAVMIDVAAEAVHEVQAVIEHRPNPPGGGSHFTPSRGCRRGRRVLTLSPATPGPGARSW